MRFTELHELARKDETPDERAHHDRRRAELRAAHYAGIAVRDAREQAGSPGVPGNVAEGSA